MSVRGDDRETAAHKENRCQPNSGKHGDHTAKSRFLLFPLSNKTMAPLRLIKWVIEGVRALPSAPNISLSPRVSLSNPLTLGHCLSSSPLSRHVPSLLCRGAPPPAEQMLTWAAGQKPGPDQLLSGGMETPIISLTIMPSQLSPHLRVSVDRCGGTVPLAHCHFSDRGCDGGGYAEQQEQANTQPAC